MSGLKIGDIVMVGGAASAEDRAKNAGRFRTVIGFVPAGFVYTSKDGKTYRMRNASAHLDGCLWSEVLAGPLKGEWIEGNYKNIAYLVKINPGDGEDEILTRVGKPKHNKQLEQV
jgi:hypothetical protein